MAYQWGQTPLIYKFKSAFHMKFLKRFFHMFSGWHQPAEPEQFSADSNIRFTCPPEELLPLTPCEQDELDILLQTSHLPIDAIGDLTALDGFLTCLVIGPKPIQPSEWLYNLFDGQCPKLTESNTTRLLALIQRQHHSIALGFARPKVYYRPLFAGFTRAKKAKPVGGKLHSAQWWCSGFMRATGLRWREWGKLLDPGNTYSLLYMPWILGTTEGHEQQMQRALDYYLNEGYAPDDAQHMVARWLVLPGTHLRMVSDLKKCIMHIHAYWKQDKRIWMKFKTPTISPSYKSTQAPFQDQ